MRTFRNVKELLVRIKEEIGPTETVKLTGAARGFVEQRLAVESMRQKDAPQPFIREAERILASRRQEFIQQMRLCGVKAELDEVTLLQGATALAAEKIADLALSKKRHLAVLESAKQHAESWDRPVPPGILQEIEEVRDDYRSNCRRLERLIGEFPPEQQNIVRVGSWQSAQKRQEREAVDYRTANILLDYFSE